MKNLRMGLYLCGHPVAISRISQLLCGPKARFMPQLDVNAPHLSADQEKELNRFIADDGITVFRNATNRQQYVPVTRADLANFLFQEDEAYYMEPPKPWKPSDVKFSNLVGLSISNSAGFSTHLGVKTFWTETTTGIHKVRIWDEEDDERYFGVDRYGDDVDEENLDQRSSYEDVYLDPPICRHFEITSLPLLRGVPRQVLDVRFSRRNVSVLFRMGIFSGLARRFNVQILGYEEAPLEDYGHGLYWFCINKKIMDMVDNDRQSAIDKLARLGFDADFCRYALRAGPASYDDGDTDDGYFRSNDGFDAVAHAIGHAEEKNRSN